MTNEVYLNRPCRVCKVPNRYHEVFSPSENYWSGQFQLAYAPKLVPQIDHYAEPMSNLEYLEHLYESRNH